MRMLPLLFLLPFCAASALAQPATPPPVAPRTEAAASAPRAAAAGHHRMGWEQRFTQANTSHDGHLTLDQAKSGYVTIARHFTLIDTDHKGYVTLDDIRAWHKQQREARHTTPRHSDDSLRPRPALHRSLLEQPLSETSSTARAVPAIPGGPPPAPPKGLAAGKPS